MTDFNDGNEPTPKLTRDEMEQLFSDSQEMPAPRRISIAPDEPKPNEAPAIEQENFSDEDEEDLDLEEIELSEEVREPLHKRGWVKAGTAAVGTLVVFLVVGAFLNSIMGTNVLFMSKTKSNNDEAIAPADDETDPPANPTGVLKSELALGKQEEELRRLNQKANRQKAVKPIRQKDEKRSVQAKTVAATPPPQYRPSPAPRYYTRPTSTFTPVSRPLASTPRTVPRPAPLQVASRTPSSIPTQTLKPVSPPLPPALPPTVPAQLPQRVDRLPPTLPTEPLAANPQERWVALAQVGSYGSLPPETVLTTDAIAETPTRPTLQLTSAVNPTPTTIVEAIPQPPPPADSTETPTSEELTRSSTPTPSAPTAADPTEELPRSSTPAPSAPTAADPTEELPRSSTPSPSNPTATPSPEELPIAPTPATPETVTALSPSPSLENSSPLPEEAAILNSSPSRTLLVGTRAEARVTTTAIWGGEARSREGTGSQAFDRFLIRLSQPLIDSTGNVALPEGSQIVAQMDSVAESGWPEIAVVAAIVNGREQSLPPGAIAIRGREGNPLMASKYGDRSSLGSDAEVFVFGALGKAGEVLNRPASEAIVTGTNGTTITRTNGKGNVGAAVLEGGFDKLSQQVIRRREAALQEVLQRPKVWVLKAGEDVEVFVNQTIDLL